jgi:hypothetical protein
MVPGLSSEIRLKADTTWIGVNFSSVEADLQVGLSAFQYNRVA